MAEECQFVPLAMGGLALPGFTVGPSKVSLDGV